MKEEDNKEKKHLTKNSHTPLIYTIKKKKRKIDRRNLQHISTIER